MRTRLVETLLENNSLVICYRSSWGGNTQRHKSIAVHAIGCGDIAQEIRKTDAHTEELSGTFSSKDAIIKKVIDILIASGHDEESRDAWSRDIEVYPCCFTGPAIHIVPAGKCKGSLLPWPSNTDFGRMFNPCPICHISLGSRGNRVPMHSSTVLYTLPDGRKVTLKNTTTHVVVYRESGRLRVKEYLSLEKATRAEKLIRSEISKYLAELRSSSGYKREELISEYQGDLAALHVASISAQ